MKKNFQSLFIKSKIAIIGASLLTVMVFNGCKKETQTDPTPISGTKPAYMLSIISSNPDVRTTYVGAVANIPTGSVTNSGMLEFGNAYFYGFDGAIFVWDRDATEITRYEVDDNMKLTKGKTISFANYGFKYGAELTFISSTKAIMMVTEQDKVIIWNPSTMEVTTDFAANIPQKTGLDVWPGPIGSSGNYMYYGLFYSNWDNMKIYPKAMVAAVPLDGTTDVKVFEDDRTFTSYQGYKDGNGDIYFLGAQDGEIMKLYSAEGSTYPTSGILKINAGTTSFDETFFVDLSTITGGKGIVGTWRIDNDNVLARVWDPADAIPATSSDYYTAKSFVSKKINLKTGAISDFPVPAKGGFSSNIQDNINGVTYFPTPAADGSGDVCYKILPNTAEEVFRTSGGGYWGFQVIR